MFRVSPRVAIALAVFGLFGVLGLATGYAVWSDIRTRDELKDVQRAVTVSNSYRDATASLNEAQLVVMQALLGERGGESAFTARTEEIREAMRLVAAEGSADDVAIVLEIMRIGNEGVAAMEGFFEEVERGAAPGELPAPGIPAAMKETLRDPAIEREAGAAAALDRVVDAQNRGLILTLAVFTVAFVTVVFCLWVLRRAAHRQVDAEVELRTLRKAAGTDPLTGLGNQRVFEEKLRQLILEAGHGKRPLSLALFDVDEFKHINDTWGHDRGDEVLRDIAAVLQHKTRHGELAFRLGGDEFALIMPGIEPANALRTADRLREGIAAEGRDSTVSVGLASLAPGEADPRLLREQADSALYDAKARGRNMVQCFDGMSSRTPVFRSAKVDACRALIASPRVDVVFQPIWNLADGSLLAVEALIRPPEGSRLAPTEAFQIAERIGRAHELDDLCQRSILERARELPDGVMLFVNISPHTLDHPAFSPTVLAQRVARTGISPQRIVLEMTERSEVPVSRILPVVTELRALGFRLALDDVGAGSQGFDLLRRLPLDYVKVSRAVVAGAGAGRAGRAALMAIIAFAAEAGSYVVAEGVDQEQLLEFVRQLDGSQLPRPVFAVHGVQGYLLGRPSAEFPSGARSVQLRQPAA